MYWHIRYDRHRALKIENTRLKLTVSVQHRPSRNRKRPVHPGGHNHPAVSLSVQLYIGRAHFNFKVVFQLEKRAVAVGSDYFKRSEALLRHGKRNYRRAVSRDIILFSRKYFPNLPFLKPHTSHFLKSVRRLVNGVIRRRRFFYKCEKFGNAVIHILFLRNYY